MSTYNDGGGFKFPKIFWIILAVILVVIIIVIIFYQIQLGQKNKKTQIVKKAEVTTPEETSKDAQPDLPPIYSYQNDPNNVPCNGSDVQASSILSTPAKSSSGYYYASLYSGDPTKSDCGIFVVTPKPYRKVYKAVSITGYVYGKGWTAPDGIVGTATLFSQNKKQLSVSFPVVASGPWDTTEEISFSSKILYTEKPTESLGYVEIVHIDPISNQKYIHRVTVSF